MRHAPIIALIAVVVVFAFFCILMPDRISDISFLLSLAVMALATGNMLYSPASAFSRKSETARLGTVGLSVLLSIAVLLIAIGSFTAAYLYHKKLSLALDVLAVGLCVGGAVFQSLVSKHLRTVEEQRKKPSPHVAWKDSLLVLSRSVTDAQAAKALKDLAEETGYLARNTEIQFDVDDRIDDMLRNLKDMCRDQKNQEILAAAAQLKSLFQEREVIVKSARRKV